MEEKTKTVENSTPAPSVSRQIKTECVQPVNSLKLYLVQSQGSYMYLNYKSPKAN